jgi:protein tyrosine/serine phosphatase
MRKEYDRFISLQGCTNFRDLGGYPARNGRTVKWSRLFRSDSLHGLSPPDVNHIYDILGVVTVLDLRNADEVQRDRHRPPAALSVGYHNLPLLERYEFVPYDPAEDPAARLSDFYLWLLSNAGGRMAGALATLGENGSLPAVFYCAAGKDRTGVFAALTLGVLGVDDDHIVSDYLLTNQRLEQLAVRLRAIPGNERRPSKSFEAQPKAMKELLSALRAGYGDAEGYVKAHGVGEATIDRLRAFLLE